MYLPTHVEPPRKTEKNWQIGNLASLDLFLTGGPFTRQQTDHPQHDSSP